MSKVAMYAVILSISVSFGIARDSSAQAKYLSEVALEVSGGTTSLLNFLKEVESKSEFTFAYSKKSLRGKTVVLTGNVWEMDKLLKEVSNQSRLSFHRVNNSITIVESDDEIEKPILTETILEDISIAGKVLDEAGEALPGANVLVKGSTLGTITDIDGNFNLTAPENSVLVISYVGYQTIEVPTTGRSTFEISLEPDFASLEEIVVIGYGEKNRNAITGAISDVKSSDIEGVKAATTSGLLAGKIAGVSFRQMDGRPGAGANIQVRNLGNPLYVIDGIQKDEGQFNNIAPGDIESITVLKDASASVYGSRAANGVVIVKTKRGSRGEGTSISIDSYTGWQTWSRFPKGVNAYEYQVGRAESDINQYGATGITSEELDRWQQGTEPGYQSFDWYDFIVEENAPQSSFNISASGGSEKFNYYLSVSDFSQTSVLGREFTFDRQNFQANFDVNVTDDLKVGMQVSGRIETRDQPGIPGADDYWAPRFAILRNWPTERPYANDNPNFPNNIGHNAENWALHTREISGYWTENWRVMQPNFTAEYQLPIKGLSVKGLYSYYQANREMNGHEYTYDVYTYDPNTDEYNITGGSQNPWRERGTRQVIENVAQGHVNFQRNFGAHNVGATFVYERIEREDKDTWVHSVPETNTLQTLFFNDMDTYNDNIYEEARIGYVGRLSYDYDNRYFVEFSGRRDASWKFAPGRRWGNFYSVSGGWRISEEAFYQNSGLSNVLDNLKIRASYGELGDDNINEGIPRWDGRYIDEYAYILGYTYPSGTAIIDGQEVSTTRQNGAVPIDNISWFNTETTNIGLDFGLLSGKVNGTVDVFRRKRSGLRAAKDDVVVPAELGYLLAEENLNSDGHYGGDMSLSYSDKIGELTFSVGGNFMFSRKRQLSQYKPRFGNSWDNYRWSIDDRWSDIHWGHQVVGQFQTQDEINNHTVDNDNQGNRTMLPGDLIYKDVNNDGVINDYDVRPIGYAKRSTPIINYGLNITLGWKGFDFTADFSGGSMYSFERNWELRVPYQAGGNLVSTFYEDRWHREDPLDIESDWVSGKNPPLRFNDGGHNNYNKSSEWWMVNLRYLRLRTLQLGYTVPAALTQKVKIEKLRFYVNTYNMFSLDNVKSLGIDPEVAEENGLAYPQSKLVNLGFNLTF